MNSLPSELLNCIANDLDIPSLVIFRMANTSIRNTVSMKDFGRPKQWRGRFFIKFCEKFSYANLIEYAENCGLKYEKVKSPQSLGILGVPDAFQPIENIEPYLDVYRQNLSVYKFNKKFSLTKETLEIMAKWARKNSLNTLYFTNIFIYHYHEWTNSLENITFIDRIFCPDWTGRFFQQITISNVDVIKFIISKGRTDILGKLEIFNLLRTNASLSDWQFYFSNSLIDLCYDNTCPMQPFEFPMAENIEYDINHLITLNIKIPIDVVFRIVSNGEYNVLNKILSAEYINKSDVDYLIENFEKVKINLYGKAPFDRTLYNEIMEILIGHRERLRHK